MAGVVALCFGAWFTIAGAIAETEKNMQQDVQQLAIEYDYQRIENDIWRHEHQLQQIEERREADRSYSWDERREKQLTRGIDILIKKQESLIDKYEILSK